jgi:FtsP/CotA-like multicopper oxidase with cupredoxin domain
MNIKQTDEPGTVKIAGQENKEAQRPIDPSAEVASIHVTRRDFLRVAMVSVAALAASRVPVLRAAGGGGGTVTRNPLRIPPPASPTNFSLTAAPSVADLGGGKNSAVLAYNSFFPGPTFRANRDDSASIQFTNGLSEATTVHWHGMIVPTSADGQPQDTVAPGASYVYQFPIMQRACLNWYHQRPRP